MYSRAATSRSARTGACCCDRVAAGSKPWTIGHALLALALHVLEQAVNDDRVFVVLRALNTIHSLRIDSLPSGMMDRVRELQRSSREEWGNQNYVRDAAASIADTGSGSWARSEVR